MCLIGVDVRASKGEDEQWRQSATASNKPRSRCCSPSSGSYATSFPLVLPTHRCKACNEVVLRGRSLDVDVVVVNHAMIVARYGRTASPKPPLFGFPPGFFLLRPHLLLHHGLQLRGGGGGGGCCCFRGC